MPELIIPEYFADAIQRLQVGQAFASVASQNSRLTGVDFWITPGSGRPGINAGFPFTSEDFYAPPAP